MIKSNSPHDKLIHGEINQISSCLGWKWRDDGERTMRELPEVVETF